MKRAVFNVWLLVWAAMCCYGFGFVPRSLKDSIYAFYDEAAKAGLPTIADFRPGAWGLGGITLGFGVFITLAVYVCLFNGNN